MISEPMRRISACSTPTALASASSERKELEQTSSARPSVDAPRWRARAHLVQDDGDAGLRDLPGGFHDVVYDPKASDNEQRSADILRDMSAGIDVGLIANVCSMILATEKHRPSTDASTKLLLDLDLAVLGAAPAEYDAYVTGVRQEYSFLPDEKWNAGRKKVLERFLERPVVYQTSHFRHLLEQNARQNILREISSIPVS
jgi:predicted metal-dependent HD superfamily phosphohydrolase